MAGEQTMTPSQTVTDGQIDKAGELFRSILKRHRSELPSEAVQQVLKSNEVWPAVFAVFRQRVEAVSDMIVRHVKPDRSRSPQQVLDVTGRRLYVTDSVVATMPRGEGEKAEVVFFRVGRFISDDDLEKEYELRGLRSADSYSLAAVNEDDPSFADDHPNCTHWKDADGGWCYTAFRRWRGSRYVNVHRYVIDWYDAWWFAGLRK